MGSHAEGKLLHDSVQYVGQRQVGQVVVVLGDGDVGFLTEGPQGRHSCDQAVVGQHDALGVACTSKARNQ